MSQTKEEQLEFKFEPEIIARLEALLFASPEGLSLHQLSSGLEMTKGDIKKSLKAASVRI